MSKRKKVEVFHQPGKNDLMGFSLKQIKPITIAQNDVFKAFEEGYDLFLHGFAGTGKTFLSLYLAFNELINNPGKYQRVIIVRSAVSSRDVGFLPGTLEEKLMAYESPYVELSKELFGRGDAYEILSKKAKITFLSSSFLRGTTFRNSIVIADEIQNFSENECVALMTRIGGNSRVIISGDTDQNDLIRHKNDQTWIYHLQKIIEKMERFDSIEFQIEDIVRSGFVKEFLIAKSQVV